MIRRRSGLRFFSRGLLVVLILLAACAEDPVGGAVVSDEALRPASDAPSADLDSHDLDPPEEGELAPDFELSDSTGRVVTLSEVVADAPTVLLFYRGHW